MVPAADSWRMVSVLVDLDIWFSFALAVDPVFGPLTFTNNYTPSGAVCQQDSRFISIGQKKTSPGTAPGKAESEETAGLAADPGISGLGFCPPRGTRCLPAIGVLQ